MQEAEDEKKGIQKVSQQQIDAESLVEIQYLKNGNTSDAEIEGFASIISQVDHRLYAACEQILYFE